MRKEENNPTERIGRVLADFQDLSDYCDRLVDLIVAKAPLIAEHMPTRPVALDIAEEQQRRKFTLSTVKRNRAAMRRSRERSEPIRGRDDYSDLGISDAVRKQLEDLLDD